MKQSIVVLLFVLGASEFVQRGTVPGTLPSTPQTTIQSTNPGVIEGVVRTGDTNEPIRDAAVMVTGIAAAVSTDAAGRFRIADLPFGAYTVRIEKEGYFPPAGSGGGRTLAGRNIVTLSETVLLSAQRPSAIVTASLLAAGSIAGRILDRNGNAVAAVQVEALSKTYQGGKVMYSGAGQRGPRGISSGQILSDDRGAYRLWGLPPDEYWLRAVVQQRAGAARGGAASNTTTYYPAALDVGAASPLRVRPGIESIADIRLQTLSISPLTLAVRVPGVPGAVGQYFLIPKDWQAVDNLDIQTMRAPGSSPNSPSIIIPRPGAFDLVLLAPDNAAGRPNAPRDVVYYTGRVSINVREQPSEPVTIPVSRTFSLGVVFNTSDDPELQGRTPLQLELVALGTSPLPSLLTPRQSTAAGPQQQPLQRTFSPVTTGQYVLLAQQSSLLGKAYVADMRQGGKSILEDGIISIEKESAEPVEIVLKAGGGTVKGDVLNPERRSLSHARIVLVPTGARQQNLLLWKDATISAAANPPTGFYFFQVTPGLYRAFAFESMPAGAERSAEFLKPYEGMARTIQVTGDAVVVEGLSLPLIRSVQ